MPDICLQITYLPRCLSVVLCAMLVPDCTTKRLLKAPTTACYVYAPAYLSLPFADVRCCTVCQRGRHQGNTWSNKKGTLKRILETSLLRPMFRDRVLEWPRNTNICFSRCPRPFSRSACSIWSFATRITARVVNIFISCIRLQFPAFPRSFVRYISDYFDSEGWGDQESAQKDMSYVPVSE